MMHCTSSVHVRVVAWCEFIYITCKAVYSLVKLMPSTDKWTLEVTSYCSHSTKSIQTDSQLTEPGPSLRPGSEAKPGP